MTLLSRYLLITILAMLNFGCKSQKSQSKETSQNTISSTTKQPNLIVIHTDEHNFRTLSCYQKLMAEDQAFVWGAGNNVTTPNIDKLANQGAIATSYYCASPVCTPSRASLVTGMYPQATGAPKNGLHLKENIPTFAKILRDHGYATSYVGKWHLAGHAKYAFGVKDNGGFTDNRYMMKGGHAPYFQLLKDGNVKGINDKAASKLPEDETIHLTDYFTNKSLEILERDKNKPFCLMLSIPDPHTPDYAKPPYNTMYKNMDVQPPKTMAEKYTAIRPKWAAKGGTGKGSNEAQGFDEEALKQYFGMVKHIDDSVGRILEFLEDNNLTNNTIVVFTSDHGDMFFEHNRRNKGIPYEASARIPFVLRYPDKVKAGKVLNTAYTNVDFAPTILKMMGVSTSVKFHGLDTSEDFLNNENQITGDRITYYSQSGGWWAASVNNRYKFVLGKNEKPYLFDLEKDPNELINFYDDKSYIAIAKQMQAELLNQMALYKEPGLENNRPYILK